MSVGIFWIFFSHTSSWHGSLRERKVLKDKREWKSRGSSLNSWSQPSVLMPFSWGSIAACIRRMNVIDGALETEVYWRAKLLILPKLQRSRNRWQEPVSSSCPPWRRRRKLLLRRGRKSQQRRRDRHCRGRPSQLPIYSKWIIIWKEKRQAAEQTETVIWKKNEEAGELLES